MPNTFRASVKNLHGKSAYIMLGGQPVQAAKLKVTDDMVEVELPAPLNGITKLFVHIDQLVLAS